MFISYSVFWECVYLLQCILGVCLSLTVYSGSVFISYNVFWECVYLLQCILGGPSYAAERYDAKFFEKLRSQNIVQTAIMYAQVGNYV